MKEFATGPKLGETSNVHDVVLLRVLTKSGKHLGRVREVRVRDRVVEGLVVRKTSGKSIYVGIAFVKNITQDAVLLNFDPVLYEGRKVITADGKPVGKVVSVLRKGRSNTVENISVKHWWQTKIYKVSEVKSFGPTIILKANARKT